MESGVVMVQQIEVRWDKSSRRSSEAAQRNRLPTALPLPAEVLKPRGQTFVHTVSFDPLGKSVERVEQYERAQLANIREAELEVDGERLTVLLRPDLKWTDIPRPRLTLPLGKWGRLTRRAGSATSGYRQVTFNFGYFLQADPMVFLRQEPMVEREDLRATL